MGDLADDTIDFSEEDEVRCQYCNERGLYWTQDARGKSVLIDEEGAPHRCSAFSPPIDISELEEFE